MNFKINKTKLYNALMIVSRAVSPNSPVPTLSGIKVEASKDGLKLTGSDSDISIEMNLSNSIDEELGLSILEEGSIVIDSKYLSDIVKKMDSDEIQVEIIDGTLTRFAGNKVEFKINGYRSSDYPQIDFSKPETNIKLKASLLTSMIEETAFATSSKETRPVLMGVNLHSNGKQLNVTATDSYRLAKKVVPLESDPFNITVPSKSLNEVKSIFNEAEKEIDINLSEKKIQFKSDNILLQSRLLDGGYPETERLIPKGFNYDMVINRHALMNAIDRTSFIKTDNMSIIRLLINDKDDITITNKSQEIGEFREDMSAISYKGEPLDISFSGNYVMDACRSLKSENVKIKFTGDMKPFILTKEENEEDLIQLVLPVRTYN